MVELSLTNESGWNEVNERYEPLGCLNLPAPMAVIELTKCGGKTGYTNASCLCVKNNMVCMPLCKCSGLDSDNCTTAKRQISYEEDSHNSNE